MKKYLEISNSKSSIVFWSISSFMFAASMFFLCFTNENLYISLSQEDSVFENMTAFFYFIAGGLLIISFITNLKKSKIFWKEILTLLLALFFIFIAGEEISWGQRIFKISTTELVREYNVQYEFTIHNLKFFSNSIILDQHRLLNLFVLLNGMVFPLFYVFNQKFRKLMNLMNFPIVPLSCFALFSIAILYEKIISILGDNWVHAEVRELLFSVGFIIFSVSLFTGKNRLPSE